MAAAAFRSLIPSFSLSISSPCLHCDAVLSIKLLAAAPLPTLHRHARRGTPPTAAARAIGADSAAPSGPPPPGEPARLFVGNLPYTTTSAELAEAFAEAGTVDSVEVIYDRLTERSRGFAFVTMATAGEAREAIELFNGAQMGGRTVRVNFPEVPRGGEREVARARSNADGGGRPFVDSPHKVYAGNLGWSVTSQGLRDAFAEQPGLLGARVIYERDTGRSRGFGFVSFTSEEDMLAAIEAMNGTELEGRPLRLSRAAGTPQPRPPFSSQPRAPQPTRDDDDELGMEDSSSSLQTAAASN